MNPTGCFRSLIKPLGFAVVFVVGFLWWRLESSASFRPHSKDGQSANPVAAVVPEHAAAPVERIVPAGDQGAQPVPGSGQQIVKVLDRAGSVIRDAFVLGLDAQAESIVWETATDDDGVATLPSDGSRASHVAVIHSKHRLEVLKAQRFPDMVEVVLDDRLQIICQISGVPAPVVGEHEFKLSCGYDGSTSRLLRALDRRLAADSPIRMIPWPDGNAALAISLICLPDSLEVTARKRLDGGRLGPRFRSVFRPTDWVHGKVASFRFTPPLPATYGAMDLRVKFDFPKDSEVQIVLRGPMVEQGGAYASSEPVQKSVTGRAGDVLRMRAEELPFGVYSCQASVVGHGVFELGPVRFSGQKEVFLGSPDWVNVIVESPSSLVPLDVRICTPAGLLVSGRRLAAAGAPVEFILPAHSEFVVDTVSEHGRLGTPRTWLRTSGASEVMQLAEPQRLHDVKLRAQGFRDTSPSELLWCTLRHLESGVSWNTMASVDPVFAVRGLSEGTYEAVVHGGVKSSDVTGFRVPVQGGTIDLW